MDYSLVKDLFGYSGSSEFLAIAAGASAYALKLLVQFVFAWRSSRESSIRLLLENYEKAKGDFYLVEQVFAERYRINIELLSNVVYGRSCCSLLMSLHFFHSIDEANIFHNIR